MYLLRNKDKNLLTFEIIKKETEVTSPTTTTSQVGVAYQVRVDSLCEDVARLPLQMQGGNRLRGGVGSAFRKLAQGKKSAGKQSVRGLSHEGD